MLGEEIQTEGKYVCQHYNIETSFQLSKQLWIIIKFNPEYMTQKLSPQPHFPNRIIL